MNDITLIIKQGNLTNTFKYKVISYEEDAHIINAIKDIKSKYFIFLGENELLKPINIALTKDCYYFDYIYQNNIVNNFTYGYEGINQNKKNVFLQTIGIQNSVVKTEVTKTFEFNSLVELSHELLFKDTQKLNYTLFDIRRFLYIKEDIQSLKKLYTANILNSIYKEADNEFYVVIKNLLNIEEIDVYANPFEKKIDIYGG